MSFSIKEQLLQVYRNIPPVNLNHELQNATIVAGTGRSGTTWLAQIINHANEYRHIFEPFHPERVQESKQRLNPHSYMPPEWDNEDKRTFVEDVLTGKFTNSWTNRINKKFISEKRLVKTIHGNFLLKWIREQFPPVSMVLILRHPCAVAYSKRKTGWWTAPDLEHKYLTQPILRERFLEGVQDKLHTLQSPFEKFVGQWCIENLIPLRSLNPRDVHLVFYEALVEHPELILPGMFNYLNKPYDESILEKAAMPSYTTRPDSPILHQQNVLTEWQMGLTSWEIDRAMEILEWFGLDKVYGPGPMPLHDANKINAYYSM
ncbi:MAG: sulfotransferase [Bacteroidia bacterium]